MERSSSLRRLGFQEILVRGGSQDIGRNLPRGRSQDVGNSSAQLPRGGSQDIGSQKKKHIWTAVERQGWIDFCSKTGFEQGFDIFDSNYGFQVLPKLECPDEEDPLRNLATKALGKTIFTKRPEYREISLKIYEVLMNKILYNQNTRNYVNEIVVMMKGSNAYKYLVGDRFPEDFEYSDTDIVIYINPYLRPGLFDNLYADLRHIVLTTISQHKRCLDAMFCLNRNLDDNFLAPEVIKQFKKDYQRELDGIKINGKFTSPFLADFPSKKENAVVTMLVDGKNNIKVQILSESKFAEKKRNFCSKYSTVLVPNIHPNHNYMAVRLTLTFPNDNSVKVKFTTYLQNSIVKVQVPHYDRCDKIPLQKSPIFCSYNKTIKFSRGSTNAIGNFELYRIRISNQFVSNNSVMTIPADFIDITIPSQNDSELIDFWNHGKSINIRDSNIWLKVPTIQNCLDDLYKMLHIYNGNDAKRTKRQRKFNILKGILNGKL